MQKEHSSNNFMIKKFGVPYGNYKWIPEWIKDTFNPKGPKEACVPKFCT